MKIRRTDKLNVDLFKRLVDLTMVIASKYQEESAYKAGLEGLYVGLETCLKTGSYSDFDLDNYLAWYIKTSIEYKLGYKTEDTKLWGSKTHGVKI